VTRSKIIDGMICNGDELNSIRGQVKELVASCAKLTIPEKLASFEDELRRTSEYFIQASWLAEEMDGLKAFWRNGDRISSITLKSVKLGDREIQRSQVREKLRGIVTNARLHELKQREREALDLHAENGARHARGEQVIHRQW